MFKAIIISFVLLLIFRIDSYAQCSNFDAQWPTGTQSTTSNSLVTVTNCAYGGEYSAYNVTAGETYTWTTCGDTDFDTQLTLWNTAHTVSYSYNDDDCGLQSTITWTATFTGTVHLLVSEYNCASNATCMTVQWACTTCGIVPTPGEDCANADPLTPGTTQCGTNSFAGSFPDGGGAPTNPCNGLYNDGEYWFSYTGTGDALQLDVSGLTNTYSGIYVLDDCPTASPNCIASYSAGSSTANYSVSTPALTSGQTYYIVIANWSAPYQTDFCLDATEFPPPAASPQECLGGSTVCSDANISGNSSGSGSIQELNGGNQGCMSVEHESSWYFFHAETAGSISFTISPQNGTDDYDFAVWGPYLDGSVASGICPPGSGPLRCSWAAGGGDTGLQNGAGDNTEDDWGDKWVEDINANAGDVFILLIDNFSATTSPFDLTWSLGGGASLDCSVLPVELTNFSGLSKGRINELFWSTKSELNADYFILEKSADGINYAHLAEIKCTGNSSESQMYNFTDNEITGVITYYRLSQVDMDGKKYDKGVLTLKHELNEISVYPNPSNGELNFNFPSETVKFLLIEYIDVNGRVISEQVSSGSGTYTSGKFSTFDSGLYFVRILSENGIVLHEERVVKY